MCHACSAWYTSTISLSAPDRLQVAAFGVALGPVPQFRWRITSNMTLRCSPQRISASGMRAVARCADRGTAPLPLSGRQPSGLPRNRLVSAPVSPARMAMLRRRCGVRDDTPINQLIAPCVAEHVLVGDAEALSRPVLVRAALGDRQSEPNPTSGAAPPCKSPRHFAALRCSPRRIVRFHRSH